MTDFENVTVDIEVIINDLDSCIEGVCDACSHKGIDSPAGCKDKLMLDAMLALKASEPRVITLKEADEAPYVWLESKKGGLGVRRIRTVPTDSTAVAIQTFGMRDTFGDVGSFEKEFRCWTARPTREQMEATPWNS